MHSLVCMLASTVALALYFVYVVGFAVNMPNADDFDMLLLPVLQFREGHYLALLRPHVEHFPVLARLASLLQYHLTGQLNFRTLIIVGNLSVPLAGLAFIFLIRPDLKKLVFWTPAFLALTQIQFYQSNLWAAGVWQHLVVMPIVLLSIAFATTRGRRAAVVGLLLATVASFTQGNGIFVPFVICLWLVCQRRLVASLPFFILALFLLFFFGGRTLPTKGFEYSLADYLAYVLSFLGSPFTTSFQIAVSLGLASLLLYLALLFYQRRELQLVSILPLFVVLTASANAISRIHLGVGYAFQESRYCYAALFHWLALYFMILGALKNADTQRWVAQTALLGSLVFSLSSFNKHWVEGELRLNVIKESMVRWQIAQTGLEYPDQERAKNILIQAINEGVFIPEKIDTLPIKDLLEVESQREFKDFSRATVRIEHMLLNETWLLISGYGFLKEVGEDKGASPEEIYFVSENKRYKSTLDQQLRPDVVRHYKSLPPLKSGFRVLLKRSDFVSGDYSVFLGSKEFLINLKRQITIE